MSTPQNEAPGGSTSIDRVSSPFSEIEDLPTEMVYEQGCVSQKIVSGDSNGRRGKNEKLIPGKLMITQNTRGTYIEWVADYDSKACQGASYCTTNGVGYKVSSTGRQHDPFRYPIWKPHSLRRRRAHHHHRHSKNQVSFITAEGCPSGADRNVKLDLSEIRSITITQPRHAAEELVIYLADGSFQNPFVFHKGAPENIIAALYRYVDLEQRKKNSYIVKPRRECYSSPPPSFADLIPDSAKNVLGYVNDLATDPRAFATTVLARVGGVVVSHTQNYINNQLNNLSPTHSSTSPVLERRPEDSTVRESDADYTTNDEGYEVVYKPEKVIELSPRPKTYRGQQLSQEQWLDYMDNNGRIKNFEEIKSVVFRGGVDPNIRKPVWPFLLGLYDPNSTYEERKAFFREKSNDYKRMKTQWMTITEDQENRFHAFRDFKSLIEKDVARTDRNLEYFKGDHSEGLETLHKILMTYMMYNFNLGYVQGMSDILAPILMEVQDEVETFWLFVRFMDRINSNFEMSQAGMKQQLSDMYTILQIIDPLFSAYLDACDASNMFFAFRWMLILFKREFSTSDILTLWEGFWTELPGPNFHLVFAVAILEMHRDTVMLNKYGLSEILRHLNDLSLRIDLEKALQRGEGIYLQLLDNRDKLPERILEILGLPVPEQGAGETSSELQKSFAHISMSTSQSGGDCPSNSAVQLDQDDDRLESQYEISLSQIL